jgi:hypothetical protein
MPARLLRPALAVAAASLVVVLAACATPEPSTPNESSGASASAGPDVANPDAPDAEITEGPTEEPVPPLTIGCDELVPFETIQQVFTPNSALLPDPQIDADTAVEAVADVDGLVCTWENTSSGDTLTVAAVALSATPLTEAKNAAYTDSQIVSAFPADEGYFTYDEAGQAGEAQAFTGDVWIVARSVALFEPGEAAPLVAAAIDAVG